MSRYREKRMSTYRNEGSLIKHNITISVSDINEVPVIV